MPWTRSLQVFRGLAAFGIVAAKVRGGATACRSRSLLAGSFRSPGHQKNNIYVNIYSVNSKQLKKWLEQQGATFQPGKGSHLKVFLNGKQSALPMHGTAELGKGLEAAIKRQLGLK
jgi:mRNA interferase HicA